MITPTVATEYYDDIEKLRSLPEGELWELKEDALEWRRLRARIHSAGPPDPENEHFQLLAEAVARFKPKCPCDDPDPWTRRAAREWRAFDERLDAVGLNLYGGAEAADLLLSLAHVVDQDPQALQAMTHQHPRYARWQRNGRDAEEWRRLLSDLNAAGLHPEDEESPGAAVARALLRLRGEWQTRLTADLLLDGTDALFPDGRVHLLRTVDTVYGPVTVGCTDDGRVALVVESRQSVYRFHCHLVAAQLLKCADADAAAPAG